MQEFSSIIERKSRKIHKFEKINCSHSTNNECYIKIYHRNSENDIRNIKTLKQVTNHINDCILKNFNLHGNYITLLVIDTDQLKRI